MVKDHKKSSPLKLSSAKAFRRLTFLSNSYPLAKYLEAWPPVASDLHPSSRPLIALLPSLPASQAFGNK